MSAGKDADEPRTTTTTETSPLLANEEETDDGLPAHGSSGRVLLRLLFTSFLTSTAFGVTQVPYAVPMLIYVLSRMTCDAYYLSHPERESDVVDRCSVPIVQGQAATAYAWLSALTSGFGVVNLFVTGWLIKRAGIKAALLLSVAWPVLRLAVQHAGVALGGARGVWVVLSSQLLTVVGGPAGYLLALNAFAAAVAAPAARTAALGRLQGVAFLGTALGFLAGGTLGDIAAPVVPFRVAAGLFAVVTLWVALSLPSISNPSEQQQAPQATSSLSAFFAPLLIFLPERWIGADGRPRREYGILLLGAGAFAALLATGYIPTLLQMYAADALGFNAGQNGWLIAINALVRGLFLTFAFPVLITSGRKRMRNPHAFDLLYARVSIFVDGVLTFPAALSSRPLHLYLVAVLLPLAAGTGSAAKGAVLHMSAPARRADALAAISLVEMLARLAATAVFGGIFAAFARAGRPAWTFAANAMLALAASVVLSAARFPEEGGRRVEDDGESENY